MRIPSTRIEKKDDLDYLIMSFINSLLKIMPNINRSLLENNKKFFIILDEYIGKSINGIPKFLDDKGFEHYGTKQITTLDSLEKNLTQKDKKNIEEGKIFIGLKFFVFIDDDGKHYIKNYIILANKKDNPIVSGVKNFFSNLSNGVLGKQNN